MLKNRLELTVCMAKTRSSGSTLCQRMINQAVEDSGKTHQDMSLTAALDALKGRNIRLYSDMKAVYGEGPYKISEPFQ